MAGLEFESDRQRVQRVAPRGLIDTSQHRARDGPFQALFEQQLERPHRKRLEGDGLHAPSPEATIELEGERAPRPRSTCEDHCDGLVTQPAEHEGENARRRWVEPLLVVDGDENRPGGGQFAQHAENGTGQRLPGLDAFGHLALEQSRLQAMSLDLWKRVDNAIREPLK